MFISGGALNLFALKNILNASKHPITILRFTNGFIAFNHKPSIPPSGSSGSTGMYLYTLVGTWVPSFIDGFY